MAKPSKHRKYKRTDIPSKKGKHQSDPLSTESDLKGISGLLEKFLRSFRNLAFVFLLSPMAILYLVCLGLALTPGILIFRFVFVYGIGLSIVIQSALWALAIAAGILCFWITLIFVIPIFNFPFIFLVKPQRGTWFSLNVIPWYYHNALTQLARYMVLDYITPTPLNLLFYKMMGMKVGKGVVINTSNISDPCLIQLDDYVTIGGSATLFAHYGMKGYLIVDRVHIKRNSTIGLKASVMGDVIIGENVMVTPHTVIMPKSRIEADTMVGLSPKN